MPDMRPYQAADVYGATADLALYEWVAGLEARVADLEHAVRTVRLITSRLDAWNVGKGERYSGTVALAVQQLRKAVQLDGVADLADDPGRIATAGNADA